MATNEQAAHMYDPEAEYLGTIDAIDYYRVRVVQPCRYGVPMDTIALATWAESLEAQLLDARRMITALEEQLARAAAMRALVVETPVWEPYTMAAQKMAAHYGRALDDIAEPVASPAPPERPYYCTVCDKDFAHKPNPEAAMRGHLANGRNHNPRTAKAKASEPETPAEDDPSDGETELRHRLRSRWPRPCPECWRLGRQKECKGPHAWGQHRFAVHAIPLDRERPIIIPNALTPEPRLAPAPWPVSCLDCRRIFDSPQALAQHRCMPIMQPMPIQPAPPVLPVRPLPNTGAPLPIKAANGWACRECQSAVFAPSVKDPSLCQRCATQYRTLIATG